MVYIEQRTHGSFLMMMFVTTRGTTFELFHLTEICVRYLDPPVRGAVRYQIPLDRQENHKKKQKNCVCVTGAGAEKTASTSSSPFYNEPS